MNHELPKDNVAVRCAHCKCIVYIAVNDPRVIDDEAQLEIGKMILAGYSVEHMTIEQFRPEPFGHAETCSRHYKQQSGEPLDGQPQGSSGAKQEVPV